MFESVCAEMEENMGNIFNMDNAFFTVMGKLVDIFVISVIWLLLCIPVVTIGPATTALYYVMVKVIRRERGYLLREYFKCFKMNFKQGAIVSIILAITYLALYLDREIVLSFEGNAGVVLFTIFNAMLVIVFCVTLYIFPVLSRFKVSIKQLFKSSMFMAMRHLPSTVLMALIFVATVVALNFMIAAIVIAPALCCLACSMFMERIFKKYMPEKSGDGEDSIVDEWYWE